MHMLNVYFDFKLLHPQPQQYSFYCFQHPPRIELILKVFSDILLIELSLTFEEIAGYISEAPFDSRKYYMTYQNTDSSL